MKIGIFSRRKYPRPEKVVGRGGVWSKKRLPVRINLGAEIKFVRIVLKFPIGDWRYAGSPFAEEIGGL